MFFVVLFQNGSFMTHFHYKLLASKGGGFGTFQ